MDDTNDFIQKVDTAEKTFPLRAGEVKKGTYVLLKGFPCKIIDVLICKTGKHGPAKAIMTGTDIFTGKKYMDISPTSNNIVAPFVTTSSLQLIDIQNGYASLMDENGEIREDLKMPDENSPNPKLGEQIEALLAAGDKDVYVTITKAMDIEQITGYKAESA